MEPLFLYSDCPLLPEVMRVHGPETTRMFGKQRNEQFYLAALTYAQSLWRVGKPAQAILQLNKALSADLDGREEVLVKYPAPYEAVLWVIKNAPCEVFLGNPVRHFQHLATRVSGLRKEIRSWRAWACFHLSRSILNAAEFPSDWEQVEREKLIFPEWSTVVEEIEKSGWRGEAEVLRALMKSRGSSGPAI